MVYMNRSALLPVLFTFFACVAPIVKDSDLKQLNRELDSSVYTVTADLTADFSQESGKDVIFKKGEKLRMYLEAGPDWVRLKGYRASEKPEQAVARTLVYLIREDIKSEDSAKEIRDRIAKLAVSK